MLGPFLTLYFLGLAKVKIQGLACFYFTFPRIAFIGKIRNGSRNLSVLCSLDFDYDV